MVSLNRVLGFSAALTIVCGLQGCGDGGPSAGMPADIPASGVAPTTPTTPITSKDFSKARVQAAKDAKAIKAAEPAAPGGEATAP